MTSTLSLAPYSQEESEKEILVTSNWTQYRPFQRWSSQAVARQHQTTSSTVNNANDLNNSVSQKNE